MSRRSVGTLLIALVALLLGNLPIDGAAIENAYANGVFAALNRALVPLSNAVPFALGDLLVIVVVSLILRIIWTTLRARTSRIEKLVACGVQIAAVLAVGYAWFMLAWGYNYHREPLIARVAFDESLVTDANVTRFADRIAAILNGDVGAAHARAAEVGTGAMERRLASDFAPLVNRVGDRWPVALTHPKVSLADRIYSMAGVGGQYDPFAFETLVNGTFLPFEVPRALAHEWAHVAGFTDEGDANALGTLTCLRSNDPLIRYSGAFWTYGELPESERQRIHLDARVIADFQAAQARFLRFFEPRLFAISWHLYDRYLKANGVHAGVVSYSQFVRLLVGTRLDRTGLPELRTHASAGHSRRAFSPKMFAYEEASMPSASRPSRSRP